MKLEVDVQYALEDSARVYLPAGQDLQRWAQAAFDAAGKAFSSPPRVTIRLADEAEITRLNSEYRHMTKATNVLSFPFEMPQGLPASAILPELGDVVICASVVTREAKEQGKAVESHWAHMVVHGVLHLLGFDHITDSEAAAMEILETRVLCELGYSDPYAIISSHG